jgi:hypothetical protein
MRTRLLSRRSSSGSHGSATVAVADHLSRRSPLRPCWSPYGREIHAFALALEAVHMATSKKEKLLIESRRVVSQYY